MISSTSAPQDGSNQFDTGPLSWVMGEIREALTKSKAALLDGVDKDADTQATSLKHAKTYLHQAHGALQIVDIDGLSMMTETVEDLLERVENGQVAYSGDFARAIETGYHALLEYLEELLAGIPHQPVRMFPYYRALLELKGAERIHPADLFFPNLGVRPQLPMPENIGDTDYVGLRKRFERALLPFLKAGTGPAAASAAAAMRDIVGEVMRGQSNQHSRAFWWVMEGFADIVANGQIEHDVYIKQLFARINLQIRRLSEGSSSIAERLLRDALFFIARAVNPSRQVLQIKAAYSLGQVPTDYDKKRYGQIDVDALAKAKDKLLQAKNVWNRIASGEANAVTSFEGELQALTAATEKLGSPPLSGLLRDLSGIARHAANASATSLGLEFATSLLFVENALANINHLPEDFAERATALSTRLKSIAGGESPDESAQWLDDISRLAQQRQTMIALANEMQTNLRQVEKTLDEYFRDPSQRESLGELGGMLHQLEGAFSILDQGDAVEAVRHTKAAVERFAGSEDVPEMKEFQLVAQNVGALSFFIETLQRPSGQAPERFAFDRNSGVFQAKLIERAVADEAAPMIDIDPGFNVATAKESAAREPESDPLPTVEDELAKHQQQSAELAASLAVEPDNPMLQEQLKESLEQVRRDAALVDNPEANDMAQAAIRMLEQPDAMPSQDVLAGIIAAAPAQPQAPELAAAAPMPESDEAVDAELLEIFLGEAEEVLACIRETVPQSRNEPYNQDHLTTLRRSFHTLKGSSRMVGLMTFGEAGWSIEQVLNLRLSETRAGDADLYALLETAADHMAGWVEELKTTGRSGRTAAALSQAAERVKAGLPFTYEAAPAAEPVAEIAPAAVDADVAEPADAVAELMPMAGEDIAAAEEAAADVPPELPVVEEIELSAEDLAVFGETLPEAEAPADEVDVTLELPAFPDPQASQPAAEVIEFPAPAPAPRKADDNIKQIGSLQISLPLYNIFLAETDDLVRVLSQDIAEWRHESERDVNVKAVTASHSLAGSSATVGFMPLQEVAHALEMVLQSLARRPVRLGEADLDTLEHSISRIRFMLQMFALGDMPDPEPHQVEILESLAKDLETREGFAPSVINATYVVQPPPIDEEAEVPLFAEAEEVPEAEPEVIEAVDIPELTAELPDLAIPVLETEIVPEVMTEIEAPADEGAQIEVEAVAPVVMPAIAMEESIELAAVPSLAVPEEVADEPAPAVVAELPAQAGTSPSQKAETPVVLEAPADKDASPALLPVINDDLDADLMPIFLEEGRDMLPQIAQALRGWQDRPVDVAMPASLLRLLHTVKGSARMAGAMKLGQRLHDMETRIEHLMHAGVPQLPAIEDLLSRFDEALQMFDGLVNPEAAKAAESAAASAAQSAAPEAAAQAQPVVLQALMPTRHSGAPQMPGQAVPANRPAAPAVAAAPAALVRVRADILDRLVNQAGEVSISRSKLETEVGSIRQSLGELNENIGRLRVQLREIEMQAESQIASQSVSSDREFDPLEFDRYTRLQELTRMMAESVNDVSSLQQNLTRTVDHANDDLTTQARLTRDLQQDLMRVRMVQFASISERLYRVTRQASKEVNKRVNLDIRGGSVEMDRGVLERMAGPFEHLLRNAIVHGIESREARQTAGKSEIGELLVQIRQEGNEVVLQFSDDGGGLNLGRIRQKAVEIGLLTNDAELSDAEVGDLIFHPGFSTAEQVTELAGRGVGTDVVRSEAAALGGRVEVYSETGKGAHFTIRLPLTLAVTQVVLMSTGGKTYAVPSVLVEQVQQLKINSLTSAYNDGAVVWQGQRVPLHYLSTLLGDTDASPVAQQYSPIIILRSGNERVAVHVDGVVGNREVVVKNIGPQLARMTGIAGATVMGSGDIVLILNPVPLAQRLEQENQRAPRRDASDAPPVMGAVAEMAPAATTAVPTPPKAEPVQGLRTQNIVMVVDDSLTVRRVTQRLLAREGYQVVLAKDGVDALEHLQSITPDVMLVDIEMPRMDGFDLTRNVRGDERTRHIPIIMITSRTATKHRNYALELGVNEYLGKPYQEDTLLKLITGFVSKETPVS